MRDSRRAAARPLLPETMVAVAAAATTAAVIPPELFIFTMVLGELGREPSAQGSPAFTLKSVLIQTTLKLSGPEKQKTRLERDLLE